MNPSQTSGRARELQFSEAYGTLRQAQKTNRGAPAYSRWVNRPLGRVLAAGAYRMGMTPNQVTGVSAAFTYTAIAALALVPPSGPTSLGVAGLLLLGYALDSADGQLARLTSMGRPSGEWLDHVVDMGKICLLGASVAISWARWGTPGDFPPGTWSVAVPLLFVAVSVLSFFGWLLSDLLIRVARAGAREGAANPPGASPTPSAAPALRSLLRLPSDYGLLALTFAWFGTWMFPVTFIALLAANAAILTLALPTWFSQVQRSEAVR